MVRKIIAVIIGAVLANLIFLLVGMVANAISPTAPELMDPQTSEAVANRVAATSTFTWITVLFGLSLGAFFGGLVGVRIARHKFLWVTTALGILLSLWAFYTFYIVYPDALWVPLAMLVAAFLFSYLGGLIFRQSATIGIDDQITEEEF